ncbi:MAG: heavy-metal-associated domain-containing protein [Bacteroidota bacterium]
METIQLHIPTMKSPHCMMVVSNTLKNQAGAVLKKLSPGEAEIELQTATKTAVVEAIEKAGYQVTNK